MSKSAVKLFRNPACAAKAAEELKSQGFKAEEIGILASDDATAKKVGAKATDDIAAALAGAELSEDAVAYLELGVSLGGVLINVNADEARLAQAREIMRIADLGDDPKRFEMWSTSPAFPIAEKMSATDPLDAKMSGDFRKY